MLNAQENSIVDGHIRDIKRGGGVPKVYALTDDDVADPLLGVAKICCGVRTLLLKYNVRGEINVFARATERRDFLVTTVEPPESRFGICFIEDMKLLYQALIWGGIQTFSLPRDMTISEMYMFGRLMLNHTDVKMHTLIVDVSAMWRAQEGALIVLANKLTTLASSVRAIHLFSATDSDDKHVEDLLSACYRTNNRITTILSDQSNMTDRLMRDLSLAITNPSSNVKVLWMSRGDDVNDDLETFNTRHSVNAAYRVVDFQLLDRQEFLRIAPLHWKVTQFFALFSGTSSLRVGARSSINRFPGELGRQLYSMLGD